MTVSLSGTPVLETERLTLRAPVAADWPYWCDFALSDRSRFVRGAEPSEANAWRAFGHMIGHWVLRGYGMFVVSRRGGDIPLGAAGPWFPAGWAEQEIGWTLWSEEAEGQGIATEAARAGRAHAYDTLGWHTAVSYIHPDNAASIAVAERLGASRDEAAETAGDDVRVYRHPTPEARA